MSRLKLLYDELKKNHPACDKVTFDYDARGGVLPENWLLQTPDIWGMRAADVPVQPWREEGPGIDPDFRLPICTGSADCKGKGFVCKELQATVKKPGDTPRKLCLGHSDMFVDPLYNMMIKAQKTIHITTLGPGPDGRFMAAMRNAVTYLAHTGRSVRITFMMGYFLPYRPIDEAKRVLNDLIRDAKSVPGAKLSFAVINYGSGIHWNHSKIVVVDGIHSIVGGHNWYFTKYLQAQPVFDLSMQLSGPISGLSDTFVKEAWKIAERLHRGRVDYPDSYFEGWVYDSTAKTEGIQPLDWADIPALIADDEDEKPAPAEFEDSSAVPVLAIGRLNDNYRTAPGEIALARLLSLATESIKISQQNLGYNPKPLTHWDPAIIKALHEFIVNKKKDVVIVQTNDDAGDYSSGALIPILVREIFDRAKEANRNMSEGELWGLLVKHLRVAPLRFSEDTRWGENKGIANHSKFVMIDDEIFYIGSHNLYPPGPMHGVWRLKEFGYMVESGKGAADILEQYWNKLVTHSRPLDVTLTTDKQRYKAGEKVSFRVNVKNAPPNNDAVEFFLDNKDKLGFLWTHNQANGPLRDTWTIPDRAKGKSVTFRYIHDGGIGGMKIVATMTSITVEP